MKISIMAVLLFAASLAQAQTTSTSSQSTAGQLALPSPTAFAAVSRDGNSTVWERTVYERDPSGAVVPRKSRYTELCSGLNFFDPVSRQFQPSREQIGLLPPGGAFAAAATNGQHRAFFPLDIAQGVIQITTPSGEVLQSRPVGLFFEDDSNSVLFATLNDSVGELVGSNEVVYPNAFEGATASVRFRYARAGFEQDVLVEGQLPDPEALGLNRAKAKLGVLTVFFGTNNPVVTPGLVDAADGLSDCTLSFGSISMGPGRAFSIRNGQTSSAPPVGTTAESWINWLTNAASQGLPGGTPTFKRWLNPGQGQQRFLLEEIPYRRVAEQLNELTPMTGRLDNVSTNRLAANSFLDAIPARLLSPSAPGTPAETRGMRVSRAAWNPAHALVMDYSVTLTAGNYSSYTFQGDTTYFISGACNLTGTTTIEGGAVIKANNMGNLSINQNGIIACDTAQYRPAVFTSWNDNTVGETINGSSGTPALYDANAFLNIRPAYASIHDLRFAYCNLAIYEGYAGQLLDVTNCQFENIANAIVGYNVQLFNVLIASSPIVFYPSVSFAGPSLLAVNVTAGYSTGGSHWNCFVYPENPSSTVTLVNCLITGYPIFAYGSATLLSTATTCLPSAEA